MPETGLSVVRTPGGLDVVLRPAVLADDPYVLSCAVRTVLTDVRERSRALLDREVRGAWDDPARTRIVACLPEDPSFILGFAFGLPAVPLLDYLHVRGSFRGMGLATTLAVEMGIVRDRPAYVGFATPDLVRRDPERGLPVGLLSTGRWPHLTLRERR